jgi:hypothetical protein
MIVNIPKPTTKNDGYGRPQLDLAPALREIEQAFARVPKASGGNLTAEYIISATDATLTGAHVVPGALGPDRVPASPSAVDDEMITATTGYDPAKWTKVDTSGEVYSLDANGGCGIVLASTSQMNTLEQAYNPALAHEYIMKVCLSSDENATNSYVGIYFRDSATQHRQWFAISRIGTPQWSSLVFNAAATFSSTVYASAALGGITGRPQDWWYLKLTGDGTKYQFSVSPNGVAWVKIGGLSTYNDPTTPNKIGLFTYQQDHPGSAFVRFWRKTA